MSYIFVLYCVYWSLLLPQAAQLRLLFTCPPKNTDTKQLFPREEKHLERGLNPGLQETGLTTTLQLFWTSIRIGGMLAKVWARVQLVFLWNSVKIHTLQCQKTHKVAEKSLVMRLWPVWYVIVAVTYILEVVWLILLSRMRHDMRSYAKAHSLSWRKGCNWDQMGPKNERMCRATIFRTVVVFLELIHCYR